MSFWVTIGIIAGALGALTGLALLASWVGKLTGASQFVTAMSSVFSSMTNIIKIPIDIIGHFPKPIKMMIILILFSSIGGFLYSYSIGLTHVCGEDGKTVYKTDMISGIGYKSYPDDSDAQLAAASPNFYNSTRIDCLRAGLSSCVIAGDFSGSSQNILVGVNKTSELVLYGVGATSSFTSSGATSVPGVAGNAATCSKRLFNVDTTAGIICLDRSTGKCSLSPQNSILGSADSQCESHGFGSTAVGALQYQVNDDGDVVASFSDYSLSVEDQGIGGLKTFFGVNGPVSMSSCTPQVDANETGVMFKVSMRYYSVGALFSNNSIDYLFPLYNAQFGPLVSIPTSKICTQVVYSDRAKLLADAEKMTFKSNDLVKFSCDKNSDNKADTNMTVAGINIFDTTVMALLFLIIAVVSVFSFFRR